MNALKAGKTSRDIYGYITDDEGRCIHYASKLDIIANRCGKCGRFYSCYKCHDMAESHPFSPVDSKENDSVMCGVCGSLYSYDEYSSLVKCRKCLSFFNPRCALHKSCYVK
jgi:biotin transport system substrate-specific component